MPYSKNKFRAIALFIAATVAYGIILFLAFEYLADRRNSEDARQNEHVKSLSIAIANDIEIEISEALRPIEALSFFISETGGCELAFDEAAQKLLTDTSNIAALELAPEGGVRFI